MTILDLVFLTLQHKSKTVLFFHKSFPAKNYERFVIALSKCEKSISDTGQALGSSFNLSFLFSLLRANDCSLKVDTLNHAWL